MNKHHPIIINSFGICQKRNSLLKYQVIAKAQQQILAAEDEYIFSILDSITAATVNLTKTNF